MSYILNHIKYFFGEEKEKYTWKNLKNELRSRGVDNKSIDLIKYSLSGKNNKLQRSVEDLFELYSKELNSVYRYQINDDRNDVFYRMKKICKQFFKEGLNALTFKENAWGLFNTPFEEYYAFTHRRKEHCSSIARLEKWSILYPRDGYFRNRIKEMEKYLGIK